MKHKNIFRKGYQKLTKRNSCDSVLKTNPWTYRIRDSNGEKISFCEKNKC